MIKGSLLWLPIPNKRKQHHCLQLLTTRESSLQTVRPPTCPSTPQPSTVRLAVHFCPRKGMTRPRLQGLEPATLAGTLLAHLYARPDVQLRYPEFILDFVVSPLALTGRPQIAASNIGVVSVFLGHSPSCLFFPDVVHRMLSRMGRPSSSPALLSCISGRSWDRLGHCLPRLRAFNAH